MSFFTAAEHCITELFYVAADDLTNVVTFRTLSETGTNGAYNHVGINALTGETTCGCRGAHAGGGCWHRTLAQAALDALPARVLASRYTSDQLLRAGTKAARMLRVTRRRTWRVLPSDQLSVICCRAEWLRRKALAAAPQLAA